MHRAFAQVVEQSPRRGYDDIHAALEVVALFAVADATVHDRDPQVGELGKFLERLLLLDMAILLCLQGLV